jgi:hypothetical protein
MKKIISENVEYMTKTICKNNEDGEDFILVHKQNNKPLFKAFKMARFKEMQPLFTN